MNKYYYLDSLATYKHFLCYYVSHALRTIGLNQLGQMNSAF